MHLGNEHHDKPELAHSTSSYSAPTRHTSPAARPSSDPRRVPSALVAPFAAPSASTENQTSPTASSSSSTGLTRWASFSDNYRPFLVNPLWEKTEDNRDDPVPVPAERSPTVAPAEPAFPSERGSYFDLDFSATAGNNSGKAGDSAYAGSLNGSASERAPLEHAISPGTTVSPGHSEFTDASHLSATESTTGSTAQSRDNTNDPRPPELSDLTPFSTVFSLPSPTPATASTRPNSDGSLGSIDYASPQTLTILQELAALRRPGLHRSSAASESSSTPRSFIPVAADTDAKADADATFASASVGLSPRPTWISGAMISSAHDEAEQEYVKRQFLARGSVVKIPLADGVAAKAVVTSTTASVSASPPQTPAFLGPDGDFVALLNQDDRPTFIIDSKNRIGPLRVLYSNTSLRLRTDMLARLAAAGTEKLASAPEDDSIDQGLAYLKFKEWVLGSPSRTSSKASTAAGRSRSNTFDHQSDGIPAPDASADTEASITNRLQLTRPPSYFAGWQWAVSTIRGHYRVVRGVAKDRSMSVPSDTSDQLTTPPPEISHAVVSLRSDDPLPEWSEQPDEEPDEEPEQHHDVADVPGPELVGSPDVADADDHASALLPLDDALMAQDGKVAAGTSRESGSSFDWTRISMSDDMPPHIAFARSVDWSATPLGPIEEWSSDLRTMSNMIMASPHPAAMCWGAKYTVIYNEAYKDMVGQKHPSLMGANYPDSWPEIWDDIEPVFASAFSAGEAVQKQDNRLFVKRNGFLEETFSDWSIVPLVGSDGEVVGLYNPAFEITRRKVNERRMLSLNEVGERTAKARTIPEFWKAACEGLEYNNCDVPFALLYSVIGNNGNDDDDESGDESKALSRRLPTSPQVVLEQSVGVPMGHQAAVPFLDLSRSTNGFAPYMQEAIEKYKREPSSSSSIPPVVLSRDDGTFPTELMAGLQSERGFGDPCHTVVVIPVLNPSMSSTGAGTTADISVSVDNDLNDNSLSKSLYGFLVMGTNPRRPYNNDFRLFVDLLARQLTTSLASVVLFAEEMRRNRQAARKAAKDRLELSQQLQLRTRQAMESENKFMRMAEFTPVGMFVTDNTGRITYCNDMWWEISRHPKRTALMTPDSTETSLVPSVPVPGDLSWAVTWMDSVEDVDQPGLRVKWNRLIREKVVITHEFRFKKKTTVQNEGSDPIETTTWVLLRAYPEKDEAGELKGVFGCITDISQQKLAEEFQYQLRKEAVEHKRQQENFIDITSHEMRNPLSAILQTVDEIANSIADLRLAADSGKQPDYERALDGILESNNTISLCTNHQKRIVDDILTLSKLDSQLLPVTPADVQPVMVIRKTLKLFESELNAHNINCVFRIQPSYGELVGLGTFVKIDPSRLNQILINLMTNAIKFTQNADERKISVVLGASAEIDDPTTHDVVCPVADLTYIPSRHENPDMAVGPDWGHGKKLNLHVAVTDTGSGLHVDEMSLIFQHFSHASPRTHVQYGSSGLGLYICRNLAELQGGQVGVTSEPNRGSKFAFYIKCRKAPSTPAGVEPGSSNLTSIVTKPPTLHDPSSVIAISSGAGNRCSSETRKCPRVPSIISQHPPSPTIIESPKLSPVEATFDLLPPPIDVHRVLPPAFEPVPGTTPMPVPAPDSEAGSSECDPLTPRPLTSEPARTTLNTLPDPKDRVRNPLPEIPVIDGVLVDDRFVKPPFDVLIVEDNLVNQRVLQRQLDKGGNHTIVANHGGEAIDILRQSTYWHDPGESGEPNSRKSSIVEIGASSPLRKLSPLSPLVPMAPLSPLSPTSSHDLLKPGSARNSLAPRANISVVLMDLEMPVMDGMTCARAIRALERSGSLVRHVPIIAVTAYARKEQIESAKAAGIDEVISKPFRMAQLMPKIQELVTKYNTKVVE